MGTSDVTVRGLPELRTSLNDAAAALTRLDVAHGRVADVIIAATHPPRRTGRLAASIRRLPGDGAIVGSEVPYAAIQEGRSHYLRRAVEATVPQTLAIYEAEVADICNTVRGG